MRPATLLHRLAPLSVASATGGYTANCKNIALWTGRSGQDGWQIIADCPSDNPNDIVPWVCSTIALDLCYANRNGILSPAENGYATKTCFNCVMESTRITCYCDTLARTWPWSKTMIETNDLIENHNGVMRCFNNSAMVWDG